MNESGKTRENWHKGGNSRAWGDHGHSSGPSIRNLAGLVLLYLFESKTVAYAQGNSYSGRWDGRSSQAVREKRSSPVQPNQMDSVRPTLGWSQPRGLVTFPEIVSEGLGLPALLSVLISVQKLCPPSPSHTARLFST